MTPYAQRFVSSEEVALFEKIKDVVTRLPDIDLGENEDKEPIILSCHILARAVAKIFNLKVVDGYFAKYYDHSWLTGPGGHIIDTYPVATLGGPILMDNQRFSPAKTLYQKTSAKRISRGRFSKNSFRRSVRRISRALTITLEAKATA